MPSDSAVSAGQEDISTSPVRILVVDDQPDNIQIVGSVLGRLGHEIVPAADGLSALKRLTLRTPDLILLDLLMPDMDGCEVCRRIKANAEWKDIPVIFLSAADDKNLTVKALESGGVDYIAKPFNQAELVSRVRTQLALKSARDRLEQLAEDRDELLGILAHDLKNHLGGVQMSARSLQERFARSENAGAAQLADNISHTTGQLLAFVQEFLANSAVDHGVALRPVALDLAETVTSAVGQCREAARRKQLEIRTELPPGRTVVLADPSALRQVLDNLLSNAVKFSPAGRSIFVSVSQGIDQVELRIRDQGPGFTAEDRIRMFRRYSRLSARPTGGEPSSGLGLSIVKKLVQAMAGELACDTACGEGTVFSVRLPAPASP